MAKGIPKNGINKSWFIKGVTRPSTLVKINCKTCNELFDVYPNGKRLFCSRECYRKEQTKRTSWNKGIKNTWSKGFSKGNTPWNKDKKRPEMTGENHFAWKGGKDAYPKCSECDARKDKYKTATTLCHKCYMKQAIGVNALHWKGGINSVIKRRATLAGAIGSHSLHEWDELKKFYNYMCLCCKQQEPFIKLSEDHIIPLSLGGANDISNIQPLCKSCNSRKHTKTINYINQYETTT